jgi:outer membrane protein
MRHGIRWAASAAACILCAAPAGAQTPRPEWFVRGGLTRLDLADDIVLRAGGQVVPNADVHTDAQYTASLLVGRFIAEHFALTATVGLPPHVKVDGRKALAPFGRLGEATYGPAGFSVQYRPVREGPVQPYVGAGVAYLMVFSTKDGAFQDVEIEDDVGPVVEAGADIMLNDRMGVFLDVKKLFLTTKATGTFGGAPIETDIRLDPWVLTAGGLVRF